MTASVPETAVIEAQKAFEVTLFPESVSADNLAAQFAERYDPKKYEDAIRTYVDTITAKDEKSASLTAESVRAYEVFYQKNMGDLLKDAKAEMSRYQEAQKAIRDWTRNELGLLRAQVEAARRVAPATEAAKKAPTAKYAEKNNLLGLFASADYKTYSESKDKTSDLFENYLKTLNDQYLDLPRQKRNLIDEFGKKEGGDRFGRYKAMADTFREGMRARVVGKIDLIFYEGAAPEKIAALQEEIQKAYADFAKNDDEIGFEDLTALDRTAAFGIDLNLLVNGTGSRQAILDQLETQHSMRPEVWEKTAGGFTKRLIENAINNGQSGAIITFVKQYCVKIGRPNDTLDLKGACKELVAMTERAAKAGIRETLALWEGENGLDTIVNGPLKKSANQTDQRIRATAILERAQLLTEEVWPKNEPDRAVVTFIRSDFEGRGEILNNPGRLSELLEGVKIATVDYAKALKGYLPAGSRKLEGRAARDPARLQALILLGQEAETIIINFGQKEKYEKIKTEHEKDAPYPVDLKFGSLKDRPDNRYISNVALGGFSGIGLGGTLLQVLAGATLVANVMSSGSDAWKNPYVAASVGVLTGFHYNNRMPGGLAGYPMASEAERQLKMTHLHLNTLCLNRDFKKDAVVKFCHTSAEFNAIRALVREPSRIKKLVEDAVKKPNDPKYPVIKAADLKKAGIDEKLTGVTDDPRQSRLRYEFYKTFLLGQKSVNVTKLREDCRLFN
ncbi:hypothetical protein HZA43_03605 [Candidatus Peregrinibacteria bacterium]|nr:hypothetical protein [Candidatus Peregrinibacteria bacterium]